tara:strand:+ start:202 stop:420 length:219 start_codon:yes stop_codon:yes gene_type:complete
MDTNPTKGILSNFAKLQVPSNKPEKPKGNGMMNRVNNFTKVSEQSDVPPAMKAKQIQMFIKSKNRKYNNETT